MKLTSRSIRKAILRLLGTFGCCSLRPLVDEICLYFIRNIEFTGIVLMGLGLLKGCTVGGWGELNAKNYALIGVLAVKELDLKYFGEENMTIKIRGLSRTWIVIVCFLQGSLHRSQDCSWNWTVSLKLR